MRKKKEKREGRSHVILHFCSGRGSHSFLRRIKEDRVRCEAYLMVSPVGLVFGLLFLVTKKIGRCGKDQTVHFGGEKEGRAKRCGTHMVMVLEMRDPG